MGAILSFINVTTVNSGTKPGYLHNEISAIRGWWAGDVHFEDVHFDTYVGYPIGILQTIIFLRHTGCVSENRRKVNITNVSLTTSRYEKDPSMGETNNFGFFFTGVPVDDPDIIVKNYT